MSDVVKLRTRVEIDEEAATWAWRMDSPTVTPEQRQAYEAWLRQDPRNARAVREMSQVWDALDAIADAKQGEKLADYAASQASAAKVAAARGRWWAAAAVILTVAAIGAAWLNRK
jgi:ferric-dicitrate binding protein FerR (iron transport regulator)